jgi:hypothetical protein
MHTCPCKNKTPASASVEDQRGVGWLSCVSADPPLRPPPPFNPARSPPRHPPLVLACFCAPERGSPLRLPLRPVLFVPCVHVCFCACVNFRAHASVPFFIFGGGKFTLSGAQEVGGPASHPPPLPWRHARRGVVDGGISRVPAARADVLCPSQATYFESVLRGLVEDLEA